MKQTLLYTQYALELVAMTMMTLWLFSNPVNASGLLIADNGFGGVLNIEKHEVSVVVNNGIAVTEVHQVFRNTEPRIVEALYTFPVPNNASISNFSMIINGKEMVGEVVEKQRAREIYDSYKAVRRDPGLLEQVNFKTFELRIYPIPAEGIQDIKVTYCQKLDFDFNNATYTYPLATQTRSDLRSKTTSKFSFSIDVKSEIPITELSSFSHKDDFAVSKYSETFVNASMELKEGDLNRDVVIGFDVARPKTGVDLITSKQPDEDGYFMLTMTAGKELESEYQGMDYVFVVDISGSMLSDSKLELSSRAVAAFIKTLGKLDRFEVMTFNTSPNLLFNRLVDVNDENSTQATSYILGQKARGGTLLRPAVRTACNYKSPERPLNIVLLSDGMTDTQENVAIFDAIADVPQGTRVFCVGLGNEVNRPLLKQVADSTGGLAAFISHQDNFERQAQAFRRKLTYPVAENVSFKFYGIETYDLTPMEQQNLFYGAPVRILGRYRGSGSGKLVASGEIQGKPFEQSIDVRFPDTDDKNPEIERMWAFDQVQDLMGKIRANGLSESLKQKIVSLCEGYSIVSEFASFIVLENDAEYRRWSIKRRNAVRVKRDEAARKSLRDELTKLRDQALSNLGPKAKDDLTKSTAANESPNSLSSQSNSQQPNGIDPSVGSNQNVNPSFTTTPVNNSSSPTTTFSGDGGGGWGGGGGGSGGCGGGGSDLILGVMPLGLAFIWMRTKKRRNSPDVMSSKA